MQGTNSIPLGNRRGFITDSNILEDPSYKRGRISTREDDPRSGLNASTNSATAATNGGVRRKKNRWGAVTEDNKVTSLLNIPTSISGTMTPEQLDAYALNLRIEEITQKLRLNDVVPKNADRSRSPPPQYDSFGKRVNTREARYRKKLEDERHTLIEKALRTIPNYTPPADYRRPQRTQEKIYIPVNDYPEINFIGLLIGPRGNTLKKMETESGAKIAIRGKGSVKEGKGRTDVPHQSNMDEALHCLIIADGEDKIQKAIELVNQIIETAASIPEGQNELKRGQLRELAALNGTLRDDESQACQNCGEFGHRRHECPNRKNYATQLVCRICGNQGHIARDCKERPSAGFGNTRNSDYRNENNRPLSSSNADKEYEQLMLELGGGGPAASSNGPSLALEDSNRNDGSATWQQRGPPSLPSGPSSAVPSLPVGPAGGSSAPWQRRSNYDEGFNANGRNNGNNGGAGVRNNYNGGYAGFNSNGNGFNGNGFGYDNNPWNRPSGGQIPDQSQFYPPPQSANLPMTPVPSGPIGGSLGGPLSGSLGGPSFLPASSSSPAPGYPPRRAPGPAGLGAPVGPPGASRLPPGGVSRPPGTIGSSGVLGQLGGTIIPPGLQAPPPPPGGPPGGSSAFGAIGGPVRSPPPGPPGSKSAMSGPPPPPPSVGTRPPPPPGSRPPPPSIA